MDAAELPALHLPALDDAWHLELIAGCDNRVLIDLIQQFMRRTARYEIALMREQRNVAVATTDHEQIMDALATGDLAAACLALKRNLETGREPIERWLSARDAAGQARPSGTPPRRGHARA